MNSEDNAHERQTAIGDSLGFAALMMAGGPASAQDVHGHSAPERGSVVRVPPSLASEHEELHERLSAAVATGGKTGEAARKVDALLAPHFAEENRFALPPLGVLPQLTKGGASEEMRPAIEMGRHVEQNLERYLEEHRQITAAVAELEAAATAERKPEQARFAAALRAHAKSEEEVLYPAAILVGRYLERALEPR